MSLEAVTFYCNCWAQASTFLDVAVTVHWDYCSSELSRYRWHYVCRREFSAESCGFPGCDM